MVIGVAPRRLKPPRKASRPMCPVVAHRLKVTLVRFGHKTAVTFGNGQAKLTHG